MADRREPVGCRQCWCEHRCLSGMMQQFLVLMRASLTAASMHCSCFQSPAEACRPVRTYQGVSPWEKYPLEYCCVAVETWHHHICSHNDVSDDEWLFSYWKERERRGEAHPSPMMQLSYCKCTDGSFWKLLEHSTFIDSSLMHVQQGFVAWQGSFLIDLCILKLVAWMCLVVYWYTVLLVYFLASCASHLIIKSYICFRYILKLCKTLATLLQI